MFRQLILTAIMLAMAKPVALAINDGPIRDMQQVIASDARLSAERKASLQKIISEVLGTGPELDEDKRLHAGEHLKQYLDDYATRGHRSTKVSQLFEDTFRWNLGNYKTLAPITEQQRQAMRKLILALSDGIRLGIPTVYPDTPEPLRAELAKQVESAAQTLLESKRIGNYFYLQYLYPSQQEILPERVRDEWSRNPATAAEREKFAARLKAKQDAWDSEKSHQAQESTFLMREGVFLQGQMHVLLVQHIDRTRIDSEHYASMPKELAEAYHAVSTESNDLRKRTKELRAETARLLENADEALSRTDAARNNAARKAAGEGQSRTQMNSDRRSPRSQPATKPANGVKSQPRAQTQPVGAAERQ